MSINNFNMSLESIRMIVVMIFDILIIWAIIYYALKIVRNNTRTIRIFKGIILIVAIDALAKLLGLKTLQQLTGIFINWGFLAIIIIFQPEIRNLLERMGKTNMFSRITTLTGGEKENLVDQIVTAVMLLSKDQTGALISIEQAHSLEDFVQTGSRMNSDVTAELLTSLFVTTTPLHDGAVIIQGDKIACASAYFPPTNLELPSRYGARHRAAIGISEITDAVTIVVSEETGAVSITEGGKIFHVNRQQLRDYLLRVICGEVTEVHGKFAQTGSNSAERKKEGSKGGMLSKIAVRKQETIPEKVEAEEVVAAQTNPRSNDYQAADEEASAAEIKLPHKKEMPRPSYPVQSERVVLKPSPRISRRKEASEDTVANAKNNPAQQDDSAKIMRLRPTAEEEEALQRRIAAKAAAQKPQHRNSEKPDLSRTASLRLLDKQEEARPRKMTPEEVKAAREASMRKFSHSLTPEEQAIQNAENGIYDTTQLDISKIVGFKGELDKQFDMIDGLENKNSNGGGNA